MTTIETLFTEWCALSRFVDRWGFLDDDKDRDANPLYRRMVQLEDAMLAAEPLTAADMARLVVALGNGCLALPGCNDVEAQLIRKAFALLDLPEIQKLEAVATAAA
ncbi:MAG: hypothetical protein Q4G49_13440 [Paracoccus sp. (in: a-proteobacteria)]|nr:hypothetical protein [Paracoccus sp. (in: a-proteobacteria)]